MHRLVQALSLCLSAGLFAADTAHDRLSEAAKVLDQIMATPDSGIPQDLLAKARCVVIVPGIKQTALGVGGKFGRGFAVCRQNRASWGGPSAVQLEGGGVGFAASADIIMLVMSDHGVHGLLEDKFTLGSETTVSAGPVGRQTSGSTDAQMSAEVLSWSRSKGVFAGAALQRATLRPDIDMNQELYGGRRTNEEILTGGRYSPVGRMGVLTAALNRYSPGEGPNRDRTKRGSLRKPN